jgi:putative NADH-flavin reductase
MFDSAGATTPAPLHSSRMSFSVSWIWRAMAQAGVSRLLLVSAAFLFRAAVLPAVVGWLFFRGAMRDSEAMERVVRASALGWTIVRPPRLTDGPASGRYRVKVGHLPPFGFTASRASVADFMLHEAAWGDHVRQIVGIAG